jgi:hypothetical protein
MFADFANSADVQERTDQACAEAVLSLARGDAGATVRAVKRALEPLATLGTRHHAVKEALALGIEGALLGDDVGTAEEFLAMIDALPAGRRTRFLQGHSHRFHAHIAARRGELDQVLPGFEAAAQLFREVSLSFWLAVTLLEEGEWLHGEHRFGDAASLRGESREIFQRLGATRWLERASQLTTTEPASVPNLDVEATR